uniref:STAS domain-containing protein n=1 Tax=Nymphaea colorata TaxID=210225 RepID=A0A5K1D5L3_9MAGN
MALSNPNQKVLQTLASCGVLELIGKEWYFVRVHDAVQVCLQHVQNLKESPKKVDPAMKNEPSIFQRSWKQNDDLKEPLIV